jgi:hypothetical protein
MKLSVIAKIISFPISPFWEEAAILVGQSALLKVDYIMLTTGDLQGILDLQLRGQCYKTLYSCKLQIFVIS